MLPDRPKSKLHNELRSPHLRRKISDLHFIARGFSKRHIALRLERAPSTICREIKRNRNRNGYFVKHAHKLAKIRHSSNHKTVDPAVWKQVKSYLALQWSPEQIASYIAGKMYSIYHYILQNKIKGGYLYQH